MGLFLCKLKKYTETYALHLPKDVAELLLSLCTPDSNSFCQFVLDCSNIPAVISLAQAYHGCFDVYESFFEVTRTWAYTIHRDRLKRLNRWSGYG